MIGLGIDHECSSLRHPGCIIHLNNLDFKTNAILGVVGILEEVVPLFIHNKGHNFKDFKIRFMIAAAGVFVTNVLRFTNNFMIVDFNINDLHFGLHLGVQGKMILRSGMTYLIGVVHLTSSLQLP